MQVTKRVFSKYGAPVVALSSAAGSALAAVPADVTTAMADMKTDALVVATVFLVAFIALAAFRLMRRGAH